MKARAQASENTTHQSLWHDKLQSFKTRQVIAKHGPRNHFVQHESDCLSGQSLTQEVVGGIVWRYQREVKHVPFVARAADCNVSDSHD
jgi:hypothetical protein